MSNIINVVRRGATYHFRRSVDLGVGNRFCVSLSLRTTRRRVAKLRAARLTIRSEELLIDVMQLETPEGLTPVQRAQIFKRELAKARDGLDILYVHAQAEEPEYPKQRWITLDLPRYSGEIVPRRLASFSNWIRLTYSNAECRRTGL